MKPQLRHGAPIGQSLALPPPAFHQHICQCPACTEFGSVAWNGFLNRHVPGKAFSREEYYEHKRQYASVQGSSDAFNRSDAVPPFSGVLNSQGEFSRPVPPAIPSAAVYSLPAAQSGPSAAALAVQPSPKPASSTSQDHSRSENARPRNQTEHKKKDQKQAPRIRSAQDATSIHKLTAILTECNEQSAGLGSVNRDNLVFCTPPSPYHGYVPSTPASTINSGPYALEFDRSSNKPVLVYESWLMKALTDVDTILADGRANVASLKKSVTTKLQTEYDRIEKLKADEWNRRYRKQSKARYLLKEGVVQVVDTGARSAFNVGMLD